MTESKKNHKASVLLADDDQTTRFIIAKMLRNENYNVTMVDNGLDAIQTSKEKQFDYLITDILMPGVEGIEVISEVLKSSPDIKIIAISSDRLAGYSTLLNVAQTVGASATIKKPIRADDLINTMERI
jgi:CheY-like chemotaxis protein